MTTAVMTRAPLDETRDETGDECIVFAECCWRFPKGIDSLADALFAAQPRSVTQFNDQQGKQKLMPPHSAWSASFPEHSGANRSRSTRLGR